MAEITTTNLERTNLEAHVDLCAERYKQLDSRLTNIEQKVENISETILASKNSLNKVIIGASGTVVSSVVGLIIAIMMKF